MNRGYENDYGGGYDYDDPEAEVEEAELQEMTEEEKDAAAQRCIKFFNTILFVMGGALAGEHAF